MTVAHQIPATIDALVALWSVAPQLAYTHKQATVQMPVVDGPPLAEPDDPRVLYVGVASQYVTGGAQDRMRHGYGGRRTDRVEIACQLQVWSGDTDMAEQRSTAFAVFDLLDQILTIHRDLGGVVDWARITRCAYQADQSTDGAGVAIDFTVQAEATRFG